MILQYPPTPVVLYSHFLHKFDVIFDCLNFVKKHCKCFLYKRILHMMVSVLLLHTQNVKGRFQPCLFATPVFRFQPYFHLEFTSKVSHNLKRVNYRAIGTEEMVGSCLPTFWENTIIKFCLPT